MGYGMLDGLGNFIMGLMIICVISVPLALWKLIDIVIWIWNHVSLHLN